MYDDRGEWDPQGECQIAHDDCSEVGRWMVHTHIGCSWRICHMAWIQDHISLGDPYLTVTYERLEHT